MLITKPQSQVSSTRMDRSESRCECGQLIAKIRSRGLELKCKRCKRIVLIPFTTIEGWTTTTP